MGVRGLRELVDTLAGEGLLDDADAAQAYAAAQADLQPWYVRAMVGIGAWLASLLLIGFVVGFSFAFEGGYAVVGLILIGGAIWLRHRSRTDFLAQSALAASLAGQALFAFGITQEVGHDEFETLLAILLVMSALLFYLFPDRIHRVLMVLLAAASLTGLVYAWEANAVIPLLGPTITGALLLIQHYLPRWMSGRHAALVRPLMDGLLISACAIVALSTIYVLPELGVEGFSFYPRPWISTLLFGGLLIHLGIRVWPLIAGAQREMLPVLHGLTILVIAASWAAPGLLLGLLVAMQGAATGHRGYMATGAGYLALYTTAYFYGIEVTLLTKSFALVTIGLVLLLARWVIVARLTKSDPEGKQDV